MTSGSRSASTDLSVAAQTGWGASRVGPLILAVILPRRYAPLAQGVAATDVLTPAASMRALQAPVLEAINAAIAASDLLPIELVCDQVEMLDSKGIGVGVFAREDVVDIASYQRLAFEAAVHALRLAPTHRHQSDLFAGPSDVSGAAIAFAQVFFAIYGGETSVDVIDARDPSVRQTVLVSGKYDSRQRCQHARTVNMRGTLLDLSLRRKRFVLEVEESRARIMINYVRSASVEAALALIHLAGVPCELRVAVSLVGRSSKMIERHTLLDVLGTLQHDWRASLDLLDRSSQRLAACAVPADRWRERRADESAGHPTSNCGTEQQSMHRDVAAQGALTALHDGKTGASLLARALTPRRRKEGAVLTLTRAGPGLWRYESTRRTMLRLRVWGLPATRVCLWKSPAH